MKRLIECVPNFSEGRDASKVDAIVAAMSEVPGVYVLDREMDADHNRCVVTLAGDPEAVGEAALLGVGKAAELIDLTKHSGAHPRIGAADVIPFIPIDGVSIEDCVALARRVGNEIWNRYRIPVYFYEAAATRPERVNLENVRKGQFEGLREDALRDPDRSPDIGEPRLHPTAGATAIGVRKLLIAYNIYLNTSDAAVARDIARTIRASSGGLPYVKAIGVEMKSRGLAQVSINLTDFEHTSLRRVFEAVRQEAQKRGCRITSSEIIGLVPRRAIDSSSESDLQLDNFSAARILENRLEEAAGAASPQLMSGAAASPDPLQPLVDTLRQAFQSVAERALETPQSSSAGSSFTGDRGPVETAESHLGAAFAAGEIYERLVQLEAMAAPSILLDWMVLKQ